MALAALALAGTVFQPGKAQAQALAQAQRPYETRRLGQVAGYDIVRLRYPDGAARCEARTATRWADGAAGRGGVEVHVSSLNRQSLSYWISKASWSMQNGTEVQGTLAFNNGTPLPVRVRAVGTSGLRIYAPVSSFPAWRNSSNARLRLENGWTASWDLTGTNPAGAEVVACLRTLQAAAPSNPLAPAPRATTNPLARDDDAKVNRID
jgi:hypothetical protein